MPRVSGVDTVQKPGRWSRECNGDVSLIVHVSANPCRRIDILAKHTKSFNLIDTLAVGVDLYLEPQYEEFSPRTMWSLSNAFTSAFRELDPIPQFKAAAKLGEFLEPRFTQAS